MRKILPSLVLVAVCALTTCALPSFAAERQSSKKLTPTTLKLKVSATTVAQHTKLTFTAVITPSKATGLVIAYYRPASGGAWIGLGVRPIVKGVASGTITVNRPAGKYEGEAVYQGSGTYAKSTSNVVTVTVK